MTTILKQKPLTEDKVTDSRNIASVTEALSDVLKNTYRLVLKSHVYHWNVTGPNFFAIHNLTEEQYTDMFTAADVIAERIRALGEPVLIASADLTDGPGNPAPGTDMPAQDMIKDLLSDHKSLAGRLRALVETAESAGDPVTADLATSRAAFHEKAAWMLRAMKA